MRVKSLSDVLGIFGSLFWGFLGLLAVTATLMQAGFSADFVVKSCVLGMVGVGLLFSKKNISQRSCLIGLAGFYSTMFITALLSNDIYLLLLPLVCFFILFVVSVYLRVLPSKARL